MSDSLQIDSTQIAAWQQDSRFDYDREIVGGSQNLLEWIASVISEWVNNTFNTVLDNDVVYYTLIVLGALLVLFLLWFLWRKRSQLFYSKDRSEEGMDYEVLEDTIYGVDFDAEITEALRTEDYRQAVRLLYLQTLSYLQEKGKIDWQPSKTPSQYMRQVGQPAFSQLTRQFVLVRYGNFLATEAVFRQMKAQQDVVMGKGGDSL
ncbi:MAG: DUF4129 domain-containing protein [Prevotella sp.]|nr:DUF4129 domain-containing protein [Prevotella sp.]